MTLNKNSDFPKQQEPDDFVTEMQGVYSVIGTYLLY